MSVDSKTALSLEKSVCSLNSKPCSTQANKPGEGYSSWNDHGSLKEVKKEMLSELQENEKIDAVQEVAYASSLHGPDLISADNTIQNRDNGKNRRIQNVSGAYEDPCNAELHHANQVDRLDRTIHPFRQYDSYRQDDVYEESSNEMHSELPIERPNDPSNQFSLDPIPLTPDQGMREIWSIVNRQRGLQRAYGGYPHYDEMLDDCQYPINRSNGVLSSNKLTDLQGFVNGRSGIRRETEKPPRLQKQRSRDRLPASNRQNHHSGSNMNGDGSEDSINEPEQCVDSVGVDVHAYIREALKVPTERRYLLQLERQFTKFINEQPDQDWIMFKDLPSYHRMIVHRAARFFGLGHNVGVTPNSIVINKMPQTTRIPKKSIRDYMIEVDEEMRRANEELKERKSILRRMHKCSSFDHSKPQPMRTSEITKQKSFEDRQVNYEQARARIFQDGKNCGMDYQNKDKQRVKALWSARKSNSVDGPGRERSTPVTSASMANRANSLTILTRQKNEENQSVTSSTSSLTRNNSNNGSSVSLSSQTEHSSVTVHASAPPRGGLPYVSNDGQPVLYPTARPPVPPYQTVPLAYSSKYPVSPQNAVPQGYAHYPNPPIHTQRAMQPNGVNPNSTPLPGEPNIPVYQAPPVPYPYQRAPVQLLYYPTDSTQTLFNAVPSRDSQQASSVNGSLSQDVEHLQLDRTSQQSPVADHIEPSSCDSAVMQNGADKSDPTALASLTSPDVSSSTQTPPSGASTPHNLTSKNSRPGSRDGTSATIHTPTMNGSYNGQPNNAVYPTTTGDEGASLPLYYSPHTFYGNYPLHAGVTGQPLFAPGRNGFSYTPQSYIAPGAPYPVSGFLIDQKFTSSMLPGMQEGQGCYVQQVAPHVQGGYPGYMTSPHQPIFFVPQYHHAGSNPAFPNLPTVVTPHMVTPHTVTPNTVNGHLPPTMPPQADSPLYRPHPGYTVAEKQGQNADMLNQSTANCEVVEDIFPVMVLNSYEDDQGLNAFAALHKAKIAKSSFIDVDVAEDDSCSDLYLLFSSLDLAVNAIKDSHAENFRLVEISDERQRCELLEQIKTSKENA